MNNEIRLNDKILLPKYWKYKGEGACNIVLSYEGPKNENFTGMVLRVKKTIDPNHILSPPLSPRTIDEQSREIQEFSFVSDVMSKILDKRYIYPGKIIHVPREYLLKLDEMIHDSRPIPRKKLRIDCDINISFLIQDLTLFKSIHLPIGINNNSDKNSICIEIKPKWGFLPRSKYSTFSTHIKENKCRYCLHQYLKLNEGSVNEISGYCPLDLFSNDIKRQNHSIKELFYHPQNNLKIYRGGELIFTGSLGGGSDQSQVSQLIPDLSIDTMTETICKILSKEPILSDLKTIQKYDELDIEAIYYLYCKLYNLPNPIPYKLNYQDELDQFTNDQIQSEIFRYLISCTVKDCSIMLSFTFEDSNDINQNNNLINLIDVNTTVPLGKSDIIYQIGLVDLDKKKESSIPKYFEMDQEILKSYLEFIKNNPNNIKKCFM